MAIPLAKDIMTAKVISLTPKDGLFKAHETLVVNNIHGAPVVNEKGQLEGILTEYDLLVNGLALHMPTVEKILIELAVSKEDQAKFAKAVEEITALTVAEIMNKDPLTVREFTKFNEIVDLFTRHHRVNPIPVIDENRRVLGVISRHDILKIFNPGGSISSAVFGASDSPVDLEAVRKANLEKQRQGGRY